jgi:hypothetical protein
MMTDFGEEENVGESKFHVVEEDQEGKMPSICWTFAGCIASLSCHPHQSPERSP